MAGSPVPERADAILAGIGLTLALAGAVASLTSLRPGPALAAGALPAALAVGYALFYAPPDPETGAS